MNFVCSLSVAGPSDLSDVVFRIVDQTRYTEVLDLLYNNFHTDEPMSRALKIFDGTNRIPEADDYTLRALSENLSLMAVDSITNKLLGVSVNGVVKKGSFPITSDQVLSKLVLEVKVLSDLPILNYCQIWELGPHLHSV